MYATTRKKSFLDNEGIEPDIGSSFSNAIEIGTK
jgi:hypothetical protein